MGIMHGLVWHLTLALAKRALQALVTASKKQPLDQAAFLPCTLGLAFPWWALLEQSPLLPQHRPPSPSVLVPHIPLTLCDDASRCRVRNHPKVWLQACTRDLRQIFCAAW